MIKKAILLVGLSLISAVGMILEVTLSNLLSVMLQYHYVFLVISIALFGIGVGAFIVQRSSNTNLARPSILLSVSIFMLWLLFWRLKFLSLLLYTIPISICFVLIGVIFARTFRMAADSIAYVYGFDLFGSAVGALLGIILLKKVGGFSALVLAAIFPAIAAMLFNVWTKPSHWVQFVSLGIVVVSLWTSVVRPIMLDLKGIKNAPYEKTMLNLLNDPAAEAKIEYTYWDDFARVDVIGTKEADKKMIFMNGDSGSLMFRFNGNMDTIAYFKDTLQYEPFDIIKPKKVLVIGPGGGVDILNALLADSADITAVEISPGIIKAMKEYADFNGDIYEYPGVKTIQGDGRDFVRKTKEKFDLIILNLVTTQIAGMSTNALTENYIFTSEAFGDYFDCLTDNGAIAVIAHNDIEGMRTFFTGLSKLSQNMSMPEALKRTMMVIEPAQDINMRTSLVMITKRSLEQIQLATVNTKIDSGTLLPFYVPKVFEQLMEPLKDGKVNLNSFIEGMEYNLQPVNDNKPFFFNFDYGLPSPLKQLLLLLFFLTLLLVMILYVVGIVPAVRKSKKNKPSLIINLYFVLLGLAFMMLEVPLIQRFILYLYNPSTATALILFALLVGGSIGSFLSSRSPSRNQWLNMALVTAEVGLTAIVYSVLLPLVSTWLLPLPLVGRIVLSLIIVLPMGIAMGMPFPTGIQAVSQNGAGYVPLLYAINGIASVWGSVVAIVISVLWGFNVVFFMGGALYILAMTVCYIKGKLWDRSVRTS